MEDNVLLMLEELKKSHQREIQHVKQQMKQELYICLAICAVGGFSMLAFNVSLTSELEKAHNLLQLRGVKL